MSVFDIDKRSNTSAYITMGNVTDMLTTQQVNRL